MGEHSCITCATPIEREWKGIEKTLPFSHLVSLTTRPLLTVTGAFIHFLLSVTRDMARHLKRRSRRVSGGRPFTDNGQYLQGPSPTFLPFIWNQKQEKKRNSQKSVSCCQAQPKLLCAVVSFLRTESLLTPLNTLTLPTCLWLDGRALQGWRLRWLPGPGMPGAAGGC